MKFIGSGNFSGRKVAIFGTSASLAGGQKMIDAMTDIVKTEGCHHRGKLSLQRQIFIR